MSAAAKTIPMYAVNGTKIITNDVQENYNTGFVRLYRSLRNKSWYKKSDYVHLWIHLFLLAARKPREDWFDGKPVILKPGQFITGRIKLEDETGINQSKVERILNVFKSEQQIEWIGGAKSRLVSILNWHLYQAGEQQSEQQMNNKRTTSEQQVNTIQEVRELDNSVSVAAKAAIRPPKVSFKTISRDQFIDELKAFTEYYPKDLLNQFYKYWSEPSPSGKMKFQLERTWDTARRLENWQRRETK